jgi:hypothetical protein
VPVAAFPASCLLGAFHVSFLPNHTPGPGRNITSFSTTPSCILSAGDTYALVLFPGLNSMPRLFDYCSHTCQLFPIFGSSLASCARRQQCLRYLRTRWPCTYYIIECLVQRCDGRRANLDRCRLFSVKGQYNCVTSQITLHPPSYPRGTAFLSQRVARVSTLCRP